MTKPNPLPPLEVLHDLFEERDGVLYYRNDNGMRGLNHRKAGDIVGVNNPYGYRLISIVGCGLFKRSRLIWKLHHGIDPIGVIDHRNGIRDDDRIENLRDVPDGVNSRNVGWRDGFSYVTCAEEANGKAVRFSISCWPDEDYEGLAERLDVLIRPRIDQIYANRVGRQRPGISGRVKPPYVPFSSKQLLEAFEEREPGVLYWRSGLRAGRIAGHLASSSGYWEMKFRSGCFARSHFIWKIHRGVDPLGIIDHINGITDDDQIGNLRDVPAGVNSRNAGWRDGSSYVIYRPGYLAGWQVCFTISCWPDEDHEQLAAELHELIALEFDGIYANRVGRRRPTKAVETVKPVWQDFLTKPKEQFPRRYGL